MSNNNFNDKFNEVMDTPDTTGEFDTQDINDHKVYAVLACFGILFWIPLVACPESRYGRFWANQGLILLIADVVIDIVGGILNIIPLVGGIISGVLAICMTILFIIAIVYAAQGKAKEVPIIGGLLHVFSK